MKRYIILAGVNGAGKSTLYEALNELKGMLRINTDEIFLFVQVKMGIFTPHSLGVSRWASAP